MTGQIFAVRKDEIFLMSQPRPLRVAHKDGGWTPQALADTMLPAFKSAFYPLDRSADVFNWEGLALRPQPTGTTSQTAAARRQRDRPQRPARPAVLVRLRGGEALDRVVVEASPPRAMSASASAVRSACSSTRGTSASTLPSISAPSPASRRRPATP